MPHIGYSLQHCRDCGKIKHCLADELIGQPLNPAEPFLIQNTIHPKGRYIYYQEDAIKHLFFVKSGSVKSVYSNEQGDQQIINFYFPGDVIGLAVLNHNYQSSSAVTLEKSVICAFPAAFIRAHCEKLPNLLGEILKRFNAEIKHRHESLLSSHQCIASKRLGGFLLDLVYRQDLARNNPLLIRLSMSRADIANYLGLAPETVSRMLSKYQKHGLILANKQKIQIIDLKRFISFVDKPF